MMDIHTACEEAYKRGYERGKAEAEEEIKSKNAEIEDLKIKNEHLAVFHKEANAEIEKLTINMNAFGLTAIREKERADTARAEAIKEFAERVKDNRDLIFNTVYSNYHFGKEIDKIAKEMGVEL